MNKETHNNSYLKYKSFPIWKQAYDLGITGQHRDLIRLYCKDTLQSYDSCMRNENVGQTGLSRGIHRTSPTECNDDERKVTACLAREIEPNLWKEWNECLEKLEDENNTNVTYGDCSRKRSLMIKSIQKNMTDPKNQFDLTDNNNNRGFDCTEDKDKFQECLSNININNNNNQNQNQCESEGIRFFGCRGLQDRKRKKKQSF